MAGQSIVLPGEEVPRNLLPVSHDPKKSLKLGDGLVHTLPSAVTATQAGPLMIISKKHAIWVENNDGRHIPQTGDLVIATVHHSAAEVFQCSITSHTAYAQLPQLAFEGANKKTRPQLTHGSTVYARVSSASKFFDPEIICYNASSGKSEGLGELKGGMVFDISLSMAKRLLAAKQEEGGIAILQDLAEKVAFEIAVGRNGKIWIKGANVRETLVVGNGVQTTDSEALGVGEQKKLAKKLLRRL